MAGSSMSFTYSEAGGIARITVAWVSDSSSGGVAGTTKDIAGFLLKGVTEPGVSTEQPDDNYNIVLTDANGANILGSTQDDLLLRDETNSEEVPVVLSPGDDVGLNPVVQGPVTVTVDSAGSSNEGTLVLYVKGSVLG